jgi:hypothetical protein
MIPAPGLFEHPCTKHLHNIHLCHDWADPPSPCNSARGLPSIQQLDIGRIDDINRAQIDIQACGVG